MNENSTTVVIGRSGAGKTTFATQFIRRGLQDGQEGIFVSLDENKEQIIREAVEMGWSDILDSLDDELLGFMLKQTRKVGTVLCTLEEHGQAYLAGAETVIPMYLADCVIHLRLDHDESAPSRTLKIIKCRNSRHSQSRHAYQITRGFGIILEGIERRKVATAKVPSQLRQMLLTRALPKSVLERLEKALEGLTDEDFRTLKPEALLDLILQEYQDA